MKGIYSYYTGDLSYVAGQSIQHKASILFFLDAQNLDCQRGNVYFLHMLQLYVYILYSTEIGIFNDDL